MPMRTRARVRATVAADQPSRRQVIVTALGSGFALAVGPAAAATISTGSDGIDVAEVQIPTPSGAIPAYQAMPAHKGSGEGKGKGKGKGSQSGGPLPPLMLVVHEIFGVHEHIKDVCRRLAKQGTCAIAPELFARQGDVSKMTDFNEIRQKVVSKVPDAQVLGDLDAAVAYAKKAGVADVSRLGVTGFCWGGRIVWLYAAASPAVRAGVAWYGRLASDKTPLQPKHPLDVAASLKAPVLGLYGADDQGIPVATVEQMRKALAAGDGPARASEIKVYPGAGHAFFADYRPSYNKEAAEDGWRQMLAWMKAHGVGG